MGRALDQKNQSPLARGLLKAAIVVGIVAIASGWYLGQEYSQIKTDPEAISNLRTIWRSAEIGGLIARVHYWSSFVLLITLALSVVLMYWHGDFRSSKLRWFGGLGMLGATFFLQITGNALPLDRHDVRTVVVESGIAGRSPIAGEAVAHFVRGGDSVSLATIAQWAEWHRTGIAAAFLVALVVTLIAVVPKMAGKHGARQEQYGVLLPIISTGLLALAFQGPTGDVAIGRDFSSGAATPSWYVLPMHVMLKLFDSIDPKFGWVGAFLVPSLVAFGALTVPIWAKNLPETPRRSLLMAFILATGVLMTLNGSVPAPISGEQAVIDDPVVSADRIKPIDTALAVRGRPVFQKNCSGCHGSQAEGGSAAPKLIGFGSRVNDRVWIMRFIRHPESVRPGSPMPAFRSIPDSELEAVAEYVRSLR